MFIHTVLWNLQDGKSMDDCKKIKDLLYALKPLIKELKDVKFGYCEKKDDAAFRQITLITYFDNEEDYVVYRDHPEHLKVKEEIKKVFQDRVVSDVEVK